MNIETTVHFVDGTMRHTFYTTRNVIVAEGMAAFTCPTMILYYPVSRIQSIQEIER